MTETPGRAKETSTWPGLTDPQHSAWYIERFRAMEEAGQDLVGEARTVDAMCERGSRILDAGCGPGRHAGYLAAAGHEVVGVDIDKVLIEEARARYPQCEWFVWDLTQLNLQAAGVDPAFDAILCAGNVMDVVTEEFRGDVLTRLAAHLGPEGFIILGCRTARGFTPAALDALLPDAGLRCDARYSTWTLRPWTEESDFAVSVLRSA